MDKLDLKDSSRHLQLNCVINYFFQLYLMLHVCIRTFDVTGIVQKILGTKQAEWEWLKILLLPLHPTSFSVSRKLWLLASVLFLPLIAPAPTGFTAAVRCPKYVFMAPARALHLEGVVL